MPTFHRAVPISRDLHEPQDRRATKWRCRDCGQRVDPTSQEACLGAPDDRGRTDEESDAA